MGIPDSLTKQRLCAGGRTPNVGSYVSRRRHHRPGRSVTANFLKVVENVKPHGREAVKVPVPVHLVRPLAITCHQINLPILT